MFDVFEEFFDWIKSFFNKQEFIGPPTLGEHLNKRSFTNPLLFTKVDDYLIFIAFLYGVYKYSKK